MNDKILSLRGFKRKFEKERMKLKKDDNLSISPFIVVTTNGAFDILHAGHIKSLQTARQMGSMLIVGLNSDESIKKYKSKNRPIIPEKQRAEMLAALECVDIVVVFDEIDPREFLKIAKPDFHVKSREGYKGIEGDVVRENGGEIVLLEDTKGLSTTDIISKISNQIRWDCFKMSKSQYAPALYVYNGDKSFILEIKSDGFSDKEGCGIMCGDLNKVLRIQMERLNE